MLALVGRVHRCVSSSRGAEIGRPLVGHTGQADAGQPGASAPRGTYRYRDPDKWRAYMRGYMKRRRAKNGQALHQ